MLVHLIFLVVSSISSAYRRKDSTLPCLKLTLMGIFLVGLYFVWMVAVRFSFDFLMVNHNLLVACCLCFFQAIFLLCWLVFVVVFVYAWISQMAHSREELMRDYIIHLFSSSDSSIFNCFFFCSFLQLLLKVDCFVGRRGTLDFFNMVVILCACLGVAVAFCCVCVIATVLTKDESPHTGYTFAHWLVSFTPPRREHQVGGTAILRLFRRPIESHEMRFWVSRLDSLVGVVTWNQALNLGHLPKYWSDRMTV